MMTAIGLGSLRTMNTTLRLRTTLFQTMTDHQRKREAHVCKAEDFLSHFQCSQARKHLESNGLGDNTDPAIADQMTQKHPACKAPISTLSNDEMRLPRKGIDCDLFLWEIKVLKANVAPGLGCLHNKISLHQLSINPVR